MRSSPKIAAEDTGILQTLWKILSYILFIVYTGIVQHLFGVVQLCKSAGFCWSVGRITHQILYLYPFFVSFKAGTFFVKWKWINWQRKIVSLFFFASLIYYWNFQLLVVYAPSASAMQYREFTKSSFFFLCLSISSYSFSFCSFFESPFVLPSAYSWSQLLETTLARWLFSFPRGPQWATPMTIFF